MTENNRDLTIRWFREVWNERRNETMDELFAPDAVGHMEGGGGTIHDFKAAREGFLRAFPDFAVTVDDIVSEGDHVVVRWTVTGGPIKAASSGWRRRADPCRSAA